jgi:hypothetical protein
MKGELRMRFEIIADVTIDTDDAVLIKVLTAIQNVKAVIKAYEELPYEDVLKVTKWDWHEMADLMDDCHYDDRFEPYYDLVSHYYWLESSVSSEAYRRYAEADFIEYCTHMDEPDFDWDFYSDWHKDLYGFRPHY